MLMPQVICHIMCIKDGEVMDVKIGLIKEGGSLQTVTEQEPL